MTKRRGVKCSQVCCVWDAYDKDCDIMGESHLHPRICPIFKEQDADLWEKLFGGEKKMTMNRHNIFAEGGKNE